MVKESNFSGRIDGINKIKSPEFGLFLSFRALTSAI